MVSPDGERVTVTGDHPDIEVRTGRGQPGGYGRGPPVDGVHAVGVHVVGEAGGATDPGQEDRALTADSEVGHEHLHGGKNRVVPASRAPPDLLIGGPVLAGGER